MGNPNIAETLKHKAEAIAVEKLREEFDSANLRRIADSLEKIAILMERG